MPHIHDQLLQWYATHGRHALPWRNTNEIYHIYLSEIMLQQTQVNRVQQEYYPRFLDKFPTLQTLACAPLDTILATWSGLGYYSRARNLHASAQLSARDGLPATMEALQKLPGIGKYTASAICNFGYNQNVPVVDTNIARVLRRFFALESFGEPWEYATQFLNQKDSKHHNLALMDLGSLVCLPKNPKCSQCPLYSQCLGKENIELYTKTQKTLYENLELFYGVYIQNNQIALIPANGSMYKKMLELPTVDPIDEYFLDAFKHSYTRYRLKVNLYAIQTMPQESVLVDMSELQHAPISSLTQKAIHTLQRFNQCKNM